MSSLAVAVANFASQPKILGPLLLLVVSLCCWLFSSYQQSQKYLLQYPWIGVEKKQWFSSLRGAVRSFLHAADFGLEGYRKHSTQGRLWVCVDHTGSPEIMISSNHLEEALKIDSVILDAHSHISKLMAEKYNFGGYGVPLTVAAHEHTLLRGVSRSLNATTPTLCEETDMAIRKYWGVDNEWSEMPLITACADVVGQITNRLLVGLPLWCRDDDYLRKSKDWSRVVLKTAWAIYMIPEFLKPIVGPIMAIPSLIYHHRVLELVRPVASERLENRKKRATDPTYSWKEPLDYMKFLLDAGSDAFNHVMDNNATTLARGALMVNAAAFHATGLTLANFLLDVFSAPETVVQELREECLGIDSEFGLTSKIGLSKMIKTDSALRESMRLHVLGIKAMHRYVKPSEGYTFANGDHLPQGAHLSLPVLGRHLDEAIYKNARQYDAFRFSRERELRGDQQQSGSDKRVKAAVNASPNHLPWGIGKSQCPGRFFAVDELKEIMAHILIYYDVKHIENRPPNIFVGSQSLPSLSAKITVRRRHSKIRSL